MSVLENNSGGICVALVGATIVGGGILMFAPSMIAAYVTIHGVELFTVGAGVAAIATGASYYRRESTKRNARLQSQNEQERVSEASIDVGFVRGNRRQRNVTYAENLNENISPTPIQTEERMSALESDNNAIRSEIRRLNGLFRNLSRSQAQQVIADEQQRYVAGDYSDSDSSTEESKQPLLSEQNMFPRPPTRVSMEVAANDGAAHQGDGVVRRRRMNSTYN